MRSTKKFVIALIAVPVLLTYCLSAYRNQVELRPAQVGPRYESKSLYSLILSAQRNAEVSQYYSVVLPQPQRLVTGKHYPLILHIPSFGEDHRISKGGLKRMKELLDLREEFTAIHVYIDPTGIHGHHYFVDSEINGPVGAALVRELIPELKNTYPVDKIYLTGHSSGAWSALWLQLEYPDLFQGVWATSPDPVDFRNFYGVDLTSSEKKNLFATESGKKRIAVRGRSGSLEGFVKKEEMEDPSGNEWIAMESVFSKKGADGNPLMLFDRKTGEISDEVAKDWRRFDLLQKLKSIASNGSEKLDGKIHIYCGSLDEYFLDQPFLSFCKELKNLGLKGECELIQSRGHSSVYQPSPFAPDGLVIKIWEDIFANYRKDN